jgi:UDP-N-acetylglucosamine 1-carboxyvinyltransferase
MTHYVVSGPVSLEGDVPISGSKNSVLKIMAAALMVPGEVTIRRVPQITDVHLMKALIERLGATVTFEGDVMVIDSSGDLSDEAPYELVTKIRGSFQVLGPLIARLGSAKVAMPGGDAIGSRPVDMHLSGLRRMGATFTSEHGYIEGRAEKLTGARVLLEFPSVGATETLLMAAVLAEGTTTIENAAREPEIVDLATFLNESGAKVTGAGSPTLVVEGTDRLQGGIAHDVVPDRIEAGTYAMAAVASRGSVKISGCVPDHIELPLQKLEQTGARIVRGHDEVHVSMTGRPQPLDLVTLPFPGFPTDLQPAMMVCLAQADGPSILTENVFESRFLFVDELNRMGSRIRVEGHHAVIRGVDRLSAAPVRASDIRAGAALVLSALCADGQSEIYEIFHIERGYELFVEKLAGLGAQIELVES